MTETSVLDPIRRQLATDHETLRAAVERVPLDWRERRMDPARWSVAEILEHLATIEKNMVALFTGFLAAAPTLESAGLPHEMDAELRAKLLDRTQSIEAPTFIQPSGSVDSETALRTLEGYRKELLATIATADRKDFAAVSRPHRVFGPLNGYQWLMTTAGHEARHAAQIAEIADHVTGAPS